MVMVWLYQRLNFINSAVKAFFRCQHLNFYGTHVKIKMASFKMKNATPKHTVDL